MDMFSLIFISCVLSVVCVCNMEEILKELCCENLTDLFKEQCIDLDVFKTLNDHDLKEIIPQIGIRKKLLTKINTIRQNEISNQLTQDSTPSTPASSNASDINDIQLDDCISFSIEDLLTESPTFQDFDLQTVLQTSPLGQSILNFYKAKNSLENSHRTRLVDIICRHIYTHIINYRLRDNEYVLIGNKIVALFPTEVLSTYYIPAIKKNVSRTGKSIMAHGKLVSKVYNLSNLSGDSKKLRKRKRGTQSISPKSVNSQSKENLFEKCDFQNDVNYLWLKERGSSHNEPLENIITKWNATVEFRQNSMKTSTVSEFLNNWPILKTLRAPVLINLDFEKLYPNANLGYCVNFSKFFEVLVNLNGTNVKDEEGLNLLDGWRNCEEGNGKKVLEVILLPYLIPPKGRTIIGKTHWKHSTLEVVESMVVHIKTSGDILTAIQKQQESAANRKQTVQPYIIIEGATIYEPRRFYIIIDKEIKYDFENFAEAFDLLFKIFFVVNANYPVASNYIYTMIQKCVYGISTNYDKVFPSTEQIIHVFTHLKENQDAVC